MKRVLLISVISFAPILLLGKNVSSMQEDNDDSAIELFLGSREADNIKKRFLNQLYSAEIKNPQKKPQKNENAVSKEDLKNAFDSLVDTINAHYKRLKEQNDSLSLYKGKTIKNERLLSCWDTSVFSENYDSIGMEKLLPYVRDHIEAIKTIQSFSKCIERMDSIIRKTENQTKDISDNTIIKRMVVDRINNEINTVNNLLDRIDGINMSSFSPEQLDFYKNLSERLTNILDKYIFE